ncbi:MAG: response regulator [Nakamurella sp.]
MTESPMNDERQVAGHALILQTFLLTGTGPVGSVIICDDRGSAVDGLVGVLQHLPGSPQIAVVSHGFALVRSYAVRPADVVLVGIHRETTAGSEAVTMLTRSHPDAVVIVFGASTDIELLADAFVRGARGLLLWDPDSD